MTLMLVTFTGHICRKVVAFCCSYSWAMTPQWWAALQILWNLEFPSSLWHETMNISATPLFSHVIRYFERLANQLATPWCHNLRRVTRFATICHETLKTLIFEKQLRTKTSLLQIIWHNVQSLLYLNKYVSTR